MLSALKAVPEKAEKIFSDFWENNDKRSESIASKYDKIKKHISNVIESDIDDFFCIEKNKIFGFKIEDLLSKNDITLIKLDFLEMEIRHSFRKEV